MELEAILYQIDSGDMALPEFHRGYVWNRDQVRGLMSSLYRRYPVGSLLVWVTPTDSTVMRPGNKSTASSVRMLLDQRYSRGEVNAIANFCFLTQDANLEIGNARPEDYLALYSAKFPGALESQWIPLDRDLWKLDKYREFLAERRRILAKAANEALNALLKSPVAAVAEVPTKLSAGARVSEEADEATLGSDEMVAALVEGFGLADPETMEVIVDPRDGTEIAIADYLWADGLHGAYDEPVVLAFDENPQETERMAAAGCRVFHSVAALEAVLARRSAEMVGVAS